MDDKTQESLVEQTHDPLIRFLNKTVVICVKFLAILMVVVILWAMVDVFVNLCQHFVASISSIFYVENILTMLGGFLAVLIAIEIFMNIVFYLKKDAIHVPLVLSTALTAVARKVIILDYSTATPHSIFATAAVIFAVGIIYWLVTKKNG